MSQARREVQPVCRMCSWLALCVSGKLGFYALEFLGKTWVWSHTHSIPVLRRHKQEDDSKFQAGLLCIASFKPSLLLGGFFACGTQRRDSENQGGDEPGPLVELLVWRASFAQSDRRSPFYIPGPWSLPGCLGTGLVPVWLLESGFCC